jgi:hypothetical protein
LHNAIGWQPRVAEKTHAYIHTTCTVSSSDYTRRPANIMIMKQDSSAGQQVKVSTTGQRPNCTGAACQVVDAEYYSIMQRKLI